MSCTLRPPAAVILTHRVWTRVPLTLPYPPRLASQDLQLKFQQLQVTSPLPHVLSAGRAYSIGWAHSARPRLTSV